MSLEKLKLLRIFNFVLIFGGGSVAFIALSEIGMYMILIGTIGLFVIPIFIEKQHTKELDKLKNETVSKFKISHLEHQFMPSFLKVIALDSDNEVIKVLTRNNDKEEFVMSEIPFNKIIESAIVENNTTMSSVSVSNTVGRAVVGGVLAGGIGAIIGSNTATRNETEKVTLMKLSVVVDDLKSPIHDFEFYNFKDSPLTRYDDTYNSVYGHIDKWHKRMSVIIKRNELNSNS